MHKSVPRIKFTVAPSWNEARNNSGFERFEAVVMKSTEVSEAQLVTVAGLRHKVQEIVYTGSEEAASECPRNSVEATQTLPSDHQAQVWVESAKLRTERVNLASTIGGSPRAASSDGADNGGVSLLH